MASVYTQTKEREALAPAAGIRIAIEREIISQAANFGGI
jgi:hypothetical protein